MPISNIGRLPAVLISLLEFIRGLLAAVVICRVFLLIGLCTAGMIILRRIRILILSVT